jgi:PST family polysaccharide transporter
MDNVDPARAKWSLASIREQLSRRQGLRPILSNVSWLFANNIIRIISGLLVGTWVARYLGPEDRGYINYSVSFVALFMPLAALGLGGILIREIVRTPEDKGQLMGTSFIMQMVAFLILLPIMIGAIMIMRPDDRTAQWAVIILAVGNVFSVSRTFQFWFDSQLQSRYDVIAVRVVDLLAAGLRVMLILLAASLYAFLFVLVLQNALVLVSQVFFYLRSGESFRTWSFNLERAKSLLRDGWPLALALLAVTINLKIDSVMLGQMLDVRSVGIYGEAARLSQLWFFVPLAISTSAYPALVRAHKELPMKQQKKRDQQFLDSLAAVGYLIAIPSVILAPFVVGLLYGPEYAETSEVLSIHIWALIFIGLGFGLRRWLAVEDLTIYSLWTAISGAIVNVGLNFLMVPRFGMMGAAWSMVISSAVSGYFICLIIPRLRPLFRQLTLALLLPIRVPVMVYRQFFAGKGQA